jgi:pSer/pThr/pTyr-binding forkhead associated (FHA) protein
MAQKPAEHYITHLLIVEDDRGRQEFRLSDSNYTLGRSPDCDIRLNSLFVSRTHATLLKEINEQGYEYYRIIDGSVDGTTSANGILVNSKKVESHNLENGDEIVFGPQVFATYYYRQRDVFPTLPTDDPFDITLIDPAMVEIEKRISPIKPSD